MISIVNVTKRNNGEYGKGLQKYVLRINREEICEFEHVFENGLAKCLEQAAEAYRIKYQGMKKYECTDMNDFDRILKMAFDEIFPSLKGNRTLKGGDDHEGKV